MEQHYLLWASGPDKPGIVSAVTKELFKFGMNLEDSSMMRLGSEFGIFLIFSSKKRIESSKLTATLQPLGRTHRLSIGVKAISAKEATGKKPAAISHIVSVYGPDHPGIVYKVTECLAKRRFNITDLSTHRTTGGATAGYILLIEGTISGERGLSALRRDLTRLQRALKTKVDIRAIQADAL